MRRIAVKDYVDSLESWVNDIMELIPIGIYRTTFEGEVVFCNRFFAQMFGFRSEAEMIGYSIINVYHNKKDRGKFIKRLIDKGDVREFSLRLKKKDGALLWCSISAKATMDDEGTFSFIDGVMRDITLEDPEKSFDRYTDAVDRMRQEKFRGVLEMAGGVAHRINQPLMIINNLLMEVLSDVTAHNPNYERLEKIDAQIEKLNDIAEKIRGIEKYVTMDYVGGVKIVDIDKAASTSRRGKRRRQ